MSESLVQAKLDKHGALRRQWTNPYPARVARTHTIGEVTAHFSVLVPEERSGKQVTIAGRVVAFRRMGKASFFDLRDGTGEIQVYVTLDALEAIGYQSLCDNDIGDFLQVCGEVFRTKRGELTIDVANWALLAKCLRPLPEKWHGLKNVELRYRHRSLDLIANERVRDTFIRRSRMIAAMRRFLDERGFVEVETPMMQPMAGGATARPFITHHNTLDIDLYLRIAPELYLKRLVIGGLERVYELGKSFRNEGVSTEHNPEFTTLEIYEAYSDYEGMMSLAEELIQRSAMDAIGSVKIHYQGQEISLESPWRRLDLEEAVEDASGIPVANRSAEEILSDATLAGIDLPVLPRGKLIDQLFERFVESGLIQPTIIKDYPVDTSPLAKKKPGMKGVVERFELFIGGMELANAFTELNDPIDQRCRFEQQEGWRRDGDDEAQQIDDDFLFALEHGMPPTGGIGFGVDRLAMLLTDCSSIRDVILFPTLRTKERR